MTNPLAANSHSRNLGALHALALIEIKPAPITPLYGYY